MNNKVYRDRASKRWGISRNELDTTFPDTCSKHFLAKLATFASRQNNWTLALDQLQQRQCSRKLKSRSCPAPDWLPADVPTDTRDDAHDNDTPTYTHENNTPDNETPNDDTKHQAWDTILWITVPGTMPLSDSLTLTIPYYPQDRLHLGHDPWLDQALPLGTPTSTAIRNPDTSICVHQSLATYLAFQSNTPPSLSAHHHDWSWLLSRLHAHTLLRACSSANTLLLLQAPVADPAEMSDVYECAQRLQAIGANLTVYPRREEWWQETRKVGDVRVLDVIAQGAYRPVTCFRQGARCVLGGRETTVWKRMQSGSTRHVRVCAGGGEGSEGGGLICVVPAEVREARGSRKRPRVAAGAGAGADLADPWWFHQEFVPGLVEGEFKVFVATEPHAGGLRGLRGYVVAIAWVSVAWEGNTFPGRAVQDVDFERFGCETVTLECLHAFSLDIFERLRGLSSPCYESLEVGVRLDIGVADGRQGRGGKDFFVNEITRWYNGHYFSITTLAEPKTQICNAFAKSFKRFVGSSRTF